jgi:hypothetical protein
MYRAYEAIAVTANVKHNDRLIASHSHLVRGTKASAQIRKMPKPLTPHDSPPAFQRSGGFWMPHRKGSQGAFLDQPHAYNLYSF